MNTSRTCPDPLSLAAGWNFACIQGVACLLALALLAGCGPGGGDDGKKAPEGTGATGTPAGAAKTAADPKAAVAAAAVEVKPGEGGNLSGKVAFTGTPPKRVAIRMEGTKECHAMHSEPVLSEEVVVNGNSTLKNVFVYVKKGLEGKKFNPPTEQVLFDQHGCVYTPHVFGVMAGQTIKVTNSDAFNHNVHFLPARNREENIGQPAKGTVNLVTFRRPEMGMKVKCEVHSWMGAWCHVMDHPYHAVTGDQGTFEIKDLPPGKYTVAAWHEKYGEKEVADVEVKAKETKAVEFSFAAQ